jgi:hypothetical protein
MSETTPEQAEPQESSPEDETEQPDGDGKTFDADYVEKLRKEAAKYRTEAKANADAAKRLAEIEESQKSEVQKAAERAATLEAERDAAQLEGLRYRVAAKFSISDEDAELFLTGTDEETLRKQAERLAARAEDGSRPRQPRPDQNQGRSSAGSSSTAEQFSAAVRGML